MVCMRRRILEYGREPKEPELEPRGLWGCEYWGILYLQRISNHCIQGWISKSEYFREQLYSSLKDIFSKLGYRMIYRMRYAHPFVSS